MLGCVNSRMQVPEVSAKYPSEQALHFLEETDSFDTYPAAQTQSPDGEQDPFSQLQSVVSGFQHQPTFYCWRLARS